MFFEKDGPCPEWPMYIKGSGMLCTIQGRIALITARHCLINDIVNVTVTNRKVLATNREIGIENKWVLFKNIYYVNDVDSSPGVIGAECDIAVAISTDSDNVTSNNALPIVSGQKFLLDESSEMGIEYYSIGFPDISGSSFDGEAISLNSVQVLMKSFHDDKIKTTCEISHISDISGKQYDVSSSLNGFSGSPVYRRCKTGVKFCGIAVMAASGKLHFVKAKIICGFIQHLNLPNKVMHRRADASGDL